MQNCPKCHSPRRPESTRHWLDAYQCGSGIHGDCDENEFVQSAWCKEVAALGAIVDALPKCWRLKDGELVQDVPVVPLKRLWVDSDVAGYRGQRYDREPVQVCVAEIGRKGDPVLVEVRDRTTDRFIADLMFASPAAAEFAAKAKGAKL